MYPNNFIYIHEHWFQNLYGNIWDFLLTVRAGVFWCWQRRRGRSTTEDVGTKSALNLDLESHILKDKK